MMTFKKLLFLVSLLSLVSCLKFGPKSIQRILEAHNIMRSRVAKGNYTAKGKIEGPGSNIQKLMWDDRIAENAQRYAETLRGLDHSSDDQKNGIFSESIWITSVSDGLTDEQLQEKAESCTWSWESEYQNFGMPRDDKGEIEWTIPTSHAFAMLNGPTNRIGCGLSLSGNLHVICQYRIYKVSWSGSPFSEGATCSACQEGTKCEESTGLCVCIEEGKGVCEPDNEHVYWTRADSATSNSVLLVLLFVGVQIFW